MFKKKNFFLKSILINKNKNINSIFFFKKIKVLTSFLFKFLVFKKFLKFFIKKKKTFDRKTFYKTPTRLRKTLFLSIFYFMYKFNRFKKKKKKKLFKKNKIFVFTRRRKLNRVFFFAFVAKYYKAIRYFNFHKNKIFKTVNFGSNCIHFNYLANSDINNLYNNAFYNNNYINDFSIFENKYLDLINTDLSEDTSSCSEEEESFFDSDNDYDDLPETEINEIFFYYTQLKNLKFFNFCLNYRYFPANKINLDNFFNSNFLYFKNYELLFHKPSYLKNLKNFNNLNFSERYIYNSLSLFLNIYFNFYINNFNISSFFLKCYFYENFFFLNNFSYQFVWFDLFTTTFFKKKKFRRRGFFYPFFKNNFSNQYFLYD